MAPYSTDAVSAVLQGEGSNLATLGLGASGVVRAVQCTRRTRCRLMEMGLLPGTRVRVVRIAPLGDPLEVELRGYSLSLRAADAALVRVDRVPDA